MGGVGGFERQCLTIVIASTIASVGAAGIPSAGLVMLAGVLHYMGLPVEDVALVVGVDRLLDMVRTAVNVTGDAAISCVVAKSEKALNIKTFCNPNTRFNPAIVP